MEEISFVLSDFSDIDKIIGLAISLNELTMKTVRAANIDDKEEYLKMRDITNHVNINSKLNWIDKANRIPRYVATPLPPLNCNQMGNMWPKKVERHDKWTKSLKYW